MVWSGRGGHERERGDEGATKRAARLVAEYGEKSPKDVKLRTRGTRELRVEVESALPRWAPSATLRARQLLGAGEYEDPRVAFPSLHPRSTRSTQR
jgi:hypothetical protein